MKKAHFLILFILFALGAIVLGARVIPQARADGFGITPPYVTNDSLIRDSHYEQTIILVRSNPTQDLQTNVSINVPGADSWISIDRGTQFVMPSGTQQMPMIVSVNVPNNAKLGHYTGNIQVVVSPLAGPTAGTVGITIGAQIDVDLDVTDGKILQFKLDRVSMTNTEEGSSFLWMHFPGKVLFTMDLENTGNIPGSPEKVVFQYDDYLSGTTLETEQNTNGLDTLQPFEKKQVIAQIPTYLPQGSYHVFYKVYGKDDGDVVGQGTLDLSVLPPGTLTGYSGYNFWGIRTSEKMITLAVIVGILLVLWGLYALVRYLLGFTISRRKKGRRGAGPPPPPPSNY